MKPIIKWCGGKYQLLTKIKEMLPESWNTYYEPFLGGGAVLLDTMPSKAVVGDLNAELINMYQKIKAVPEEVIACLAYLDSKHEAAEDAKEFYYRIRDEFNTNLETNTVEQAARFIYLNKHCYNGLYRVNSKGKFNVPFNGKLEGSSVSADHARELSSLLKNVRILNTDFEFTVQDASAGDLIYFDPPYDYETNDGFVGYSKAGWTREDSIKLKHLCDRLVDRGCYVLVSNNSTTFINELFNDTRYSIEEITARRAINRKGNGRGPVPEVIIKRKNCIQNI